MGNVLVLETPDDVDDGIDLSDMAEELVTQTFPLRGPGHKPGDVDELDGGGRHLLGVGQRGEAVEAVIRHRHHTDVRFDGAKRIVGRFGPSVAQGIEQGGLPYIGKPDNSASEWHAF